MTVINNDTRILIVLLGAIGDVVRAFPLVTELKNAAPNCSITWVVESASAQLVLSHPAVDEIVEFKRMDGVGGFIDVLRKLRSQYFDISIDLQRHFKSGLCTMAGGAKKRIGFNFKNSRECNWLFQNERIGELDHFKDKIWQYLAFLPPLGVPQPKTVDFGLKVTELGQSELRDKLEAKVGEMMGGGLPPASDWVLLMIGSTWESREWPAEHFGEIATTISQRFGLCPVLVGGPSDCDRAEKIIQKSSSKIIDLTGKTSLVELVTLCSSVKFAIACDSGPMHIACATGIPVISMWGSTSPERSRPFGNDAYILQSKVGCRCCYFSRCPGLETACLNEITPNVVELMISQVLENLKKG